MRPLTGRRFPTIRFFTVRSYSCCSPERRVCWQHPGRQKFEFFALHENAARDSQIGEADDPEQLEVPGFFFYSVCRQYFFGGFDGRSISNRKIRDAAGNYAAAETDGN